MTDSGLTTKQKCVLLVQQLLHRHIFSLIALLVEMKDV